MFASEVSPSYWADLRAMGPSAFEYYMMAASKYVTSDLADGSFLGAEQYVHTILTRAGLDPVGLRPLHDVCVRILNYIVSNSDKFCRGELRERRTRQLVRVARTAEAALAKLVDSESQHGETTDEGP